MTEQTVPNRKRPIRKIVGIAICAILVYCAVSMIATAVVFRVMFPRKDGLSPLRYTYEELCPEQIRTDFSFPSGDNTLRGFRYDADEPIGLIVVVNGIGDGADAHLPEILQFLNSGWSVATWDATGVGASGGSGIRGLRQITDDLRAFLEYRRNSGAWDGLPVVVYGHSAGAYAAAVCLSKDPQIRAAVCISGFDRPVSLMYAHAKQRVGVLAAPQYPFLYLENMFLFGTGANESARAAIDESGKPVLIIGGNSDDLVPYACSLIANPEAYHNPNVRCIEITSAYRNEHSTPWLSPGSARYRTELEDPETADKALANELDPEFIETVLSFYRDAVR